MWTRIAFQPIVMENRRYKKETMTGMGSPALWISEDDAMHQNIQIKYHRPNVTWYGVNLWITRLMMAKKPEITTR